MERILLCSKKTKFHDDVLRLIYLHMDAHLPLPRVRMLSVIFLVFHALFSHLFCFTYCFPSY
jgi:hypothetical protein